MLLQEFTIVCHPGKDSELADIVFETTVQGLELQFNGGLKASEVVATFCGPKATEEAHALGKKLLKCRDNTHAQVEECVRHMAKKAV